MIHLHQIVGTLLILLTIVMLLLCIVQVLRNGSTSRVLRMVFVGLLDLQVLLGLIAFIIHPLWGQFLWHPVLMIIAVALAHVLTKESRPRLQQLIGYVLITLLMIIGSRI